MGKSGCQCFRGKFIMVKSYLEYLHKTYRCKLFPPVADSGADKYSVIGDYYELLQISNGLVCNGVEIFGCVPVVRENKGYTLPDAESVTERFVRYNFFRDKIIIGQMPESLIYYDIENGVYGVSDRISFVSLAEYSNLLDLLKSFLG